MGKLKDIKNKQKGSIKTIYRVKNNFNITRSNSQNKWSKSIHKKCTLELRRYLTWAVWIMNDQVIAIDKEQHKRSSKNTEDDGPPKKLKLEDNTTNIH